MKLTSRQRLHKTLNHQDPGKVVLDLGSTPITGINANALYRLRKALGLEDRPVKINEPLQLLGMVEEDVRQALGVDVVDVTNNWTMFGFENANWKPWSLSTGLQVEVPQNFNTTVDESGITYLYPQGDMSVKPSAKMPRGGFYFDNILRVAEEFDEDNADARSDFAADFSIYTDEQLREIEMRCNAVYHNTQYGMIGGGALAGIGDFATIPGPSVKQPKGIRDLADFMVAHYTLPSYVKELFEMQLEVGLKNAALFYQAVGDKVQAMQISGTDFGTQRGPFMSLESYREFYKPYHQKINDWIHQNTNWKTFYHSCGAIVPFLQDMHEAGVDILNPVQTSAEGMDAKWLKETWGDKFVFWGGGIDTQKVLPFGSPEEVYTEATKMLHTFAPNGGFVFNTVHNIQGPTPTENLIALYKAVADYNHNK